MKSEIVVINAAEYGIEETKAAQIRDMFRPMLDLMAEYETEFNNIVKNPVTPELSVEAGELRKKYVKVRTGTEKIHKELKAFYLNGGRFVDGWKNAQAFASAGIEEKLKAIEEHYERAEAARIEALQAERAAALLPYMVAGVPIPESLGVLDENVWINYLSGAKIGAEARAKHEADLKAAELQAIEEKRLAAVALAAEHEKMKVALAAAELEKQKQAEETARLQQLQKQEHEAELAREREALEKANKEAEEQRQVAAAALEKANKAILEERIKATQADEALKTLQAVQTTNQTQNPLILQPTPRDKSATDAKYIQDWINSFELPAVEIDTLDLQGVYIVENVLIKFKAFKNWATVQASNQDLKLF